MSTEVPTATMGVLRICVSFLLTNMIYNALIRPGFDFLGATNTVLGLAYQLCNSNAKLMHYVT